MQKEITDQSVLQHIERLVAEEERLNATPEQASASQQRLKEIGVSLDRCWDLLRQRRALREFGRDPDEAQVRAAEVVEKYKQ
ncbi:MAG: DUF2630 family protein [Gammaproteobacteria bacterium]|nr:DUF2630 family protein [Gammaproteobacteria bacterium]MDE2022822.1 DUF2630 family protein [Gammaproteobacteria bacterium]